jgi:hypothetical protein
MRVCDSPPEVFTLDAELPLEALSELIVHARRKETQIASDEIDLCLAVIQGNDAVIDLVESPWKCAARSPRAIGEFEE